MMKTSTLGILVLLAAASTLVACNKGPAKTHEAAEAVSASSVANTQPAAANRVIVYYFHGKARCRTCLGIQASIEKTIAERFGAETASAALSFQEVNIDDPANQHFIQEFNLSSSSMVVTVNKGRAMTQWENCDKVWQYAHDETALAEYAEKQIRTYLDLLKKT